MLLLLFLATILMVLNHGHATSVVTLPIPMLADFGTTILGPVKKYCQEKAEGQTPSTLCGSVDALDKKFLEFGRKVVEQMNVIKHDTDEGNSIFATIQTRMNLLSVHCHEFVNDVGELIMQTVARGWHKNSENNGENGKSAEKEKNSEKLKSLKEEFLRKVKMDNLDKLQMPPNVEQINLHMNGIKDVAIEIYNIHKGDSAEQQMAFLLDLFVVKLKHIEMMMSDGLYVSSNWTMRMTEESLDGKN